MKPVLCIPSYNRPGGIAIERCKDLPLKKFLFIRREQKELYSRWTPWYTLVLQDHGTDIGLVRKNIVNYCNKKGYSWAFILDDDISKVETLGRRANGSITSNRIIAQIPGPRMEAEAFRHWFQVAKENNLSLSSPNHRTYDRFSHGKLLINRSPVIQCILIKVPDICAVGGYHSLRETGVEDYYIQYQLMLYGYRAGKIGSIEYDCPVVGSGEGGNNSVECKDLKERYNGYVSLFMNSVKPDETLLRVRVLKSGQKALQFVWKNWGGDSCDIKLIGGNLYGPEDGNSSASL